jgi:hypothetical protein
VAKSALAASRDAKLTMDASSALAETSEYDENYH